MVSSDKKVKKTTDNRVKQFVTRNKRVSVVMLALLISSLVLVGVGLYEQYTTTLDKNNVIKMRDNARALVGKIKSSNQKINWVDDSSCVVSRPNSFDENINYSCNVRYIYKHSVTNQQDVDDLIRVITKALMSNTDIVHDVKDNSTESVKISGAINQNSYYNATSFAFNGVRMDKGMCYVRYIISDMKNSIDTIIECTVGAKKPYFEPIEEV